MCLTGCKISMMSISCRETLRRSLILSVCLSVCMSVCLISWSVEQVRDGQGRKMSKSVGNVVDPISSIDQYGADALRYTLATGTALPLRCTLAPGTALPLRYTLR